MGEVRFFTPDEAKAAIPLLRPVLAELRDAFHEYRFAKAQVEDLEQIHGRDALDSRGHPDHAEWATWRATMEKEAERVHASVRRINELGADVKDPLLGLIDFYHRRSDGDVVLLCFRDDEDTIRHWHPVHTGFSGRRPLDEL